MQQIDTRSSPPATSTAVLVCASDAFAYACCQLRGTLRTDDMPTMAVEAGSFANGLSHPDLVIQVVSADDMPDALEQLAVLRLSCPACAVLVAAIDLDGEQLDELLCAGACDFLRTPVSAVELRVRVQRALGSRGGEAPAGLRPIHPALRDFKNVMERVSLKSSRGTPMPQDIDLDGSSATAELPSANESFRAAKARVVETFERAYIENLLAANAGNVTHAARAAKKNRRAFFELMRKYKIDSEVYRESAYGE